MIMRMSALTLRRPSFAYIHHTMLWQVLLKHHCVFWFPLNFGVARKICGAASNILIVLFG